MVWHGTTFIGNVNTSHAVLCHTVLCYAGPLHESDLAWHGTAFLGGVSESKAKCALLAFGIIALDEAVSITWSGVGIFKLVKSDRKSATSGRVVCSCRVLLWSHPGL